MTLLAEHGVSLGRRNFLRMAVAAAGCSIPLSAGASYDVSVVSKTGIETHFVFDRRVSVPLDLDFDRKLSLTSTHSFAGDITSIWIDVLDPLWVQGRVATAGLTRHTEFFLLRTLALEHGYCVADTDEYPDHVFWLLSPDQPSS